MSPAAEKVTHTPTLWSADEDASRGPLDGILSRFTIYGAPGQGLVAYTIGEDYERERANADLIVLAVNNHEALLSACQSARGFAMRVGDGENKHSPEASIVYRILDTAIRSAEQP